MSDTGITLSFPDIHLEVNEVWPDGDAPNPITAADVIAVMRAVGPLRRVLDDWGLTRELAPSVTVVTPNPHWRDEIPLIPELAPDRLVITRAEWGRS